MAISKRLNRQIMPAALVCLVLGCLIALAVGQTTCSKGYRTIAVNASSTCDETNATCLKPNGSVPCCTLEAVLRAGIPPCTRILVDSDNQTLHRVTVVNGSHDFILQGNGPGAAALTTVLCFSDVNLTFTNCSNVLISGLQFQGCAIAFEDCQNVTITNSAFSSGNTTGLSLVNVGESILIVGTQFVDNSRVNRHKRAVGLFIHQQSSAIPGRYRISNCTFANNSNGEKHCNHSDTGYGGGLVIIVEGSSNNTFEVVDNTIFRNNTGCIGGGAYISIQGTFSVNNTVMIYETIFHSNKAHTLGGGLCVQNNNSLPISAQISIQRTNFFNNSATNAAGFAYQSRGEFPDNVNRTVYLTECNFTGNVANDTGGALGLFRWPVELDDTPVIMKMENCVISSNSIYHHFSGQSISFGIGIIYTVGVHITFCGTTTIESNYGTAILASSTELHLHGSVYIRNNTGIRGGAVHLSTSKLVVEIGLNLTFESNYAQLYGGAIFHASPALGVIGLNQYCIFEYEDNSITDPSCWQVNISFINNTAGLSGRSIFLSSPDSCHRSNDQQHLPFTERAYHFQPSEYDSQVTSSPVSLEFDPLPNVKKESDGSHWVSLMLGQEVTLRVNAIDIFNQSVNATVVVSLVCHKEMDYLPDEACPYDLSGTRLVQVQEGNKAAPMTFFITKPNTADNTEIKDVVILWKTLETPTALAFLNVNIRECKLGYFYDSEQQKCVCFPSDHVYCNDSSYTSCVEEGYWFGKVTDTGTFGVFPCPFGNCNYTTSRCPAGSCSDRKFFCSLSDNDHDSLCYSNRGGMLCSQCRGNYSFTFDAIDCASTDECHPGYIALVIFLVLVFWAILVTVILVVVGLDLHIGSGHLYCFFFFFSVLEHFVGGSFPSPILYVIELIVTGFIQLDPKMFGLIPVCLPGNLTNMDYAALRYIHPVFLAVVILLLVFCSRHYKLPLFQHRRAINAICILLYLSFFSLTQTSLSFLLPVMLYDKSVKVYANVQPTLGYLHPVHVGFAVVALLIQVVLVVPFLTLLLLSPCLIRCSWFNNIIMVRLKPILDEFQACYKDAYRCFAGFYLTWRQIIFLLSLIGDYLINIYLLQVFAIIMLMVHAVFQPYRKHWLNVLDTLFITDLILLSILHGSTANFVFKTPFLQGFKDFLIYLLVLFPLGYFALLCLWPILKRIYTCFYNRQRRRRRRIGMYTVNDHTTATPDEREPLIFDESVRSNEVKNQSSGAHPRINPAPTTTTVGLSQSASYHSNVSVRSRSII